MLGPCQCPAQADQCRQGFNPVQLLRPTNYYRSPEGEEISLRLASSQQAMGDLDPTCLEALSQFATGSLLSSLSRLQNAHGRKLGIVKCSSGDWRQRTWSAR
mmetsp:Transcript_40062/g.66462  ORF Transcript_40062/g.66462 Transcript_40062/m.66462 type:complete len:102 (-) Transcript_40062:491-796(-)